VHSTIIDEEDSIMTRYQTVIATLATWLAKARAPIGERQDIGVTAKSRSGLSRMKSRGLPQPATRQIRSAPSARHWRWPAA
jgi:hypothetical protein